MRRGKSRKEKKQVVCYLQDDIKMIRYALCACTKSTLKGPEKVKTDNMLAAIYILYVLYDH